MAGVRFVKLRNDATKPIFTLYLLDSNVEKVNQSASRHVQLKLRK